MAREVDVLDLRATKESKEIGWLEKAAEEVDIMLDEFEAHNALDDDEDGGRGSRKDDVASKMKLVKLKKKELAKMLQQPIFPKGFSYRYPTATGELSVPMMGMNSSKENAVTVMREAMDKDKGASSVLKGDHLKSHKGRKGAKNPVGGKKTAVAEEDAKKPANGRVQKRREGKRAAASPVKATAQDDEAKSKGAKRYYMPIPRTSTKTKKGKRAQAKKAKPAKV